jgi:hypothetical protein
VLRERHIFALPSSRGVGLCAWVLDDGSPRAVALGRAPREGASGVVNAFGPDVLWLCSDNRLKKAPTIITSSASEVRVAVPDWKRPVASRPPGWQGTLSNLEHRTYRAALNTMYASTSETKAAHGLRVAPLDTTWIATWRRP